MITISCNCRNRFMFAIILLLFPNFNIIQAETPVGVNSNDKLPPVGVDGKPMTGTDGNPVKKKQCCPYDFDSNVCKEVDGNILCGYNKNHGKLKSASHAVDKGNGCRLRNKRLECGYAEYPFDGIRRPPAWDNLPPSNNQGFQQMEYETKTSTHPPDYNVEDTAMLGLRAEQYESATDFVPGVTQCIEINNRIVCNMLRGQDLYDE